jgi:ferredoxin
LVSISPERRRSSGEAADGALFGFNAGQASWKRFLHLPEVRLWAARRKGQSFALTGLPEPELQPLAFLGVLPCDLAAIKTQDRILMDDKVADPLYRARRERALLVCVKCTHAGGTCFCASMGTGPDVREGFDLALTEVLTEADHYFIAEAGSPRGEALLSALGAEDASAEERQLAGQLVARAATRMGRELDTHDIRELLQNNLEHPRWDEVARRCLTCGNCTMVCPTCFCTTVEDTTDLAGRRAERWRKWDVCYTLDFTYLYGGYVRSSTRSRYRQWMTHKLSTWFDQFGMSGCVGCGRCITWCPVGIDITEEARAIRQSGSAPGGSRRRGG